ncbi:hypothetical protein IscW_ISCW007700 [Ixodes scapularis]|uniref:Uncharacterized protein n=1 Tax=Ixodes scapularis TaxID=6945 RepID=B7PWE1_IXOSC|nr:hypothetical protein IscW_ISCW007700 [Ixodes scapularis]|eukprot:XP_002409702.1 hypothetical protein IscW_ISCW007700 [Ixodes scapularis]
MGTGPGFPWVEAAAASGDGLRDKLLRHDPKNGVEDVCRLPNGVRVNGSVRSRGTLGGKRKKRSSAPAVCSRIWAHVNVSKSTTTKKPSGGLRGSVLVNAAD